MLRARVRAVSVPCPVPCRRVSTVSLGVSSPCLDPIPGTVRRRAPRAASRGCVLLTSKIGGVRTRPNTKGAVVRLWGQYFEPTEIQRQGCNTCATVSCVAYDFRPSSTAGSLTSCHPPLRKRYTPEAHRGALPAHGPCGVQRGMSGVSGVSGVQWSRYKEDSTDDGAREESHRPARQQPQPRLDNLPTGQPNRHCHLSSTSSALYNHRAGQRGRRQYSNLYGYTSLCACIGTRVMSVLAQLLCIEDSIERWWRRGCSGGTARSTHGPISTISTPWLRGMLDASDG